MIRIAVMLDADKVIGSTDPDDDDWRVALLPPALPEVMTQLYESENVIAGATWAGPIAGGDGPGGRYVLARDPGVRVEGCTTVTDPQTIIDRFLDSDDELVVIGGLRVFELFTPHAQIIEIARCDHLLPGDLVYDTWEQQPLELTDEVPWEGGRTLRYERRTPG